MEFLYGAELVVPLGQLLLLLILSTGCFLFRRTKLGLLINYLFTLYWGFFCNQEFLLSLTPKAGLFLFLYFGLGIVLVIIAVVSFIYESR